MSVSVGTWPLWADIFIASICASFSAMAFLIAIKTGSRQILWWSLTGLTVTIAIACYAVLEAPDSRIEDETLYAILRICRIFLACLVPVAINDAIGLHHGRISAVRRRLDWWRRWKDAL